MCCSRRGLSSGCFVLVVSLLCSIPPATPAEDDASADASPPLAWLRDLLAESSGLTVPAEEGRPREVLSTRTHGTLSDGAFILEYERAAYGPEHPERLDHRQLILYRVYPEVLDPATIAIQRFADESGSASWIVLVGIFEGAEFISYDNLVESRKENGTPELTRSRGRVRQVALGYFSDRAQAGKLMEQFGDFLRALGSKDPKAIKPRAQSDA
jgi:hypothetical protein